jgi:hypothetical protein
VPHVEAIAWTTFHSITTKTLRIFPVPDTGNRSIPRVPVRSK